MNRATRQAALLITFLSCLLGGCANYQMGRGEALPYETVYVAPVINRSIAPQAQALLSEQLASEITQRSGLRTVSDPKFADVILEVTLTHYQRDVGIRSSQDTREAQTFDIGLIAHGTLKASQGETLYFVDRVFRAQQEIYAIGSFQNAEFQGMVPLTQALAKNIADEVASVW